MQRPHEAFSHAYSTYSRQLRELWLCGSGVALPCISKRRIAGEARGKKRNQRQRALNSRRYKASAATAAGVEGSCFVVQVIDFGVKGER